jgi:hypothetical protein
MPTVNGRGALAADVNVEDDTLSVELTDGRSIAVPIGWYPRLANATLKERNNWRLIGGGHGIHWPEIDEDISVANLLLGQPSAESNRSFQDWLKRRKKKSPSRRKTE